MRDVREHRPWSLLVLGLVACAPRVESVDDQMNESSLDEKCNAACERIEECGVPDIVELPPGWDCNQECIQHWAACPAEGSEYIACTRALPCERREIFVDPRTTECRESFEGARAACSY